MFQPFYLENTAPNPQAFVPEVDVETDEELQARAQAMRDELARLEEGPTREYPDDGPRRNRIQVLQSQLNNLENQRRRLDPANPDVDLPSLPTGGQFGGEFFDQAQQEFLDFYNPQLEDKFERARRKQTLGLASRGTLESSAGARAIGDILDRYNQQRQQIASRALDRKQGLISDFETSRAGLIQQNRASADPSAAAASAAASLGRLQQQPTLTPLGAVFTDLINTGARGVTAERAGYPGFNLGIGGGGSSSSPVRVVR